MIEPLIAAVQLPGRAIGVSPDLRRKTTHRKFSHRASFPGRFQAVINKGYALSFAVRTHEIKVS